MKRRTFISLMSVMAAAGVVDKIWYNMEELIGGSEERVLIET